MKKLNMEIPEDLKTLYKHWEKHTLKPIPKTLVNVNEIIFESMVAFSNERMNIYKKKFNELVPPYSNDEILTKFRFCNIYRELDRQTIFFHTLLKPITNDFPLWLLNMAFCRFICNTDTITKVGLLSFDNENNQKVFKKLLSLPSPKYGNAYIFPISTIMKLEFNTREKFFCLYLPKVIRKISKLIQTFDNVSVIDALEIILPEFGFNLRFHWTEILIDVAYQYPNLIDLFKEFPIGPGSIPTMKKLNPNGNPQRICLALTQLPLNGFNYLEFNNKKVYLSTENWEGIGCEFRKYTNLKEGNGRKRRY